jgi:hypothetical protein
MSTPIYTPRAGSVADRVIRFLADNPDEVLSAADIAVKFDATRNNVHTLMALAVTAGMVTRTEDPDEGELVYRIGHGAAPAPAPTPAADFGAHRPFPGKRRSAVSIDVSTIRLDNNVPLPNEERLSLRDQFMALMRRMAKEQSFAVVAEARHSLSAAATALKKDGAGEWTIRDAGNGHIRCWRVS